MTKTQRAEDLFLSLKEGACSLGLQVRKSLGIHGPNESSQGMLLRSRCGRVTGLLVLL